jgi:hypothetical protein
VKAYIDRHRDDYGVEPICRVLQMAPSCYWRHAARQRNPQLRSARAQHDDHLKADIQRVWHANWQVYGADKVWLRIPANVTDDSGDRDRCWCCAM